MKRSGTVIKTVRNGQERLGKFESERNNALERIVENFHGKFTFTFQKRKNHCIFIRIPLNYRTVP